MWWNKPLRVKDPDLNPGFAIYYYTILENSLLLPWTTVYLSIQRDSKNFPSLLILLYGSHKDL